MGVLPDANLTVQTDQVRTMGLDNCHLGFDLFDGSGNLFVDATQSCLKHVEQCRLGPSNARFQDGAHNRKCVWAIQDNGRVESCTIQSYLCSGAHPRYDLKGMSIFVSKISKTEFRAWNPIDDILRLYQIKTNLDIPTMAV